jgi:hypothetical protein
MKRRQSARRGRTHRRRTSPPRVKRIVLRPGQRLVTASVIVTARKRAGGFGAVTTTVSCACTKSDPDMPDCQPVTTVSPGGGSVTVKCQMSGGCKKCTQTTTTSGVVIA